MVVVNGRGWVWVLATSMLTCWIMGGVATVVVLYWYCNRVNLN